MKSEDAVKELYRLADFVDPEQLWLRSPLDSMTEEERNQMMAGVWLRRHASELGLKNAERAKGAMYISGAKLNIIAMGSYAEGCGTDEWHRAINAFSFSQRKLGVGHPRAMYAAKEVAWAVPHLVRRFERERLGELPKAFKMCAHDPAPATPLPDNHLTCALGVKCLECPYLQAIDANTHMSPESQDEAKAWTCVTHILLETNPEDAHFEGFVFDASDREFDDRMARAFGAEFDEGGGT